MSLVLLQSHDQSCDTVRQFLRRFSTCVASLYVWRQRENLQVLRKGREGGREGGEGGREGRERGEGGREGGREGGEGREEEENIHSFILSILCYKIIIYFSHCWDLILTDFTLLCYITLS